MGAADPLTLGHVRPVFDRLLSGPLALAVSGGADSTALMHLVGEWAVASEAAAGQGRIGTADIIVITVDHGLRAGSAAEAAWVKAQAQALGFRHETLVWTGPPPVSGLQAAAREARYGLINEFLDAEARQALVPTKRCLVTAHHQDDQAETVLMRLARGSGLDGLSGMREIETMETRATETGTEGPRPLTLVRPFLQVPKARLSATLVARGLDWAADPTNESARFERIRIRRALSVLAELGVDSAALGRSARRLARARSAVAIACADAARRMTRLHDGVFAEVSASRLAEAPEECAVRTLASLLAAYGGDSARPRLSQVEALAAQLAASTAAGGAGRVAVTLGGCRVESDGAGKILVWREWGRAALPELQLQPGSQCLWDRRFRLSLARDAGGPVVVHALGEAWRQLPLAERREAPRDALATMPSFWCDNRLVAVPGVTETPLDQQLYHSEFIGRNAMVWLS